MRYCSDCKRDVLPSVTIAAGRGAVTVCPDCGHGLEQAKPEAVVAPPVVTSRPVAPPTTTNLPSLIRARKRELRKLIKDSQRELAQLERLTRPHKRATVTPIRKVAQ